MQKSAGDENSYQRALRKIELTIQQLEKNTSEQIRKLSIKPEESPLFAGITNLTLRQDSFEFCGGLKIDKVYSHVMAPYIVAFSPAEEGLPHPGPWKAASGGMSFDVVAQVSLDKDIRPTNFNRLNTLWWITSLLRLMHSIGMRVPIVSDTSFLESLEAQEEPVFWPMELDKRGIAFDGFASGFELTTSSLEWIGQNFLAGARLMGIQSFNLAYRAMEAAQRASTFAEAAIMVWSSIEALLRPGPRNVAHRLSFALATYLEEDPAARDRLYGEAKRLYAVRGQIIHAAEPPPPKDVVAAFRLARRSILLTIENGTLPEFDDLEARWKARA